MTLVHFLLGNKGSHIYNGNIYKCDMCGRSYKTKKNLDKHVCLYCKSCEKSYSSSHRYKNHVCAENLKCSSCNKLFKSMKTLTNHKCLYCISCCKIFSTNQRFSSHVCLPKQWNQQNYKPEKDWKSKEMLNTCVIENSNSDETVDKLNRNKLQPDEVSNYEKNQQYSCDYDIMSDKQNSKCYAEALKCDIHENSSHEHVKGIFQENEQAKETSQVTEPCVVTFNTPNTQLFNPVRSDWQRKTSSLYSLNGKVTFDKHYVSHNLDTPSRIKSIVGDGNCFFRSISYVVTGWENYYHFFRTKLVQHMKNIAHLCTPILNRNETVQQYLQRTKMAVNRTWATQTEIFVMSHLLKTDIYIYTCSGSNNFQWLKHSGQFLDRDVAICNQSIYLNHLNRNHYEVVLEVATTNIPDTYRQEAIYKELQNQVKKVQEQKQMNFSRVTKWRDKENNRIEENKKRRECSSIKEADRLRKQEKRSSADTRNEENRRKRASSSIREAEKVRIQGKRSSADTRSEENRRKRASSSIREAEKVRIQGKRSSADTRSEENRRKRASSSNREAEKVRKQEKRSSSHIRNEENSRKRASSSNREAEKVRKQEKRSSSHIRNEENSRKRASSSNREAEKVRKQEKRSSSDIRNEENSRKRASSSNREAEKVRIQEKRSSSDIRNEENKRKRTSSSNREAEKVRKREKRSSSDIRNEENSRKHSLDNRYKEKEHKQITRSSILKRQEEKDKKQAKKTIQESGALIDHFHRIVEKGPCYVCTCCDQLWYRESVSEVSSTYCPNLDLKLKVFTNVLTEQNKEWVCHTCLNHIKKGKIPPLAKHNAMQFPEKDPCLNLTQLEERLISPRIPFMQLRELPRGGQVSINGNIVNVPANMTSTVLNLPRTQSDDACIPLQLKRRLSYQHHVQQEMIRPNKVMSALKYLVENSALYKEEGVILDENWTLQHHHNDSIHTSELTQSSPTAESNADKDAGLSTDIISADTWDETSLEEHAVGNLDTMMNPIDILHEDSQVLAFAPCEGNTPINIFLDKNSEELSFPTIFCGNKRPTSADREVNVHLSEVYKSELRQRDRRVASHIPNIFFKVKKLQAQHILDKSNLCMRKAFNTKGITAGFLKDSENVENICLLDEGYRVFKDLRGSPPYWEKTKKDLFAMLRCLGIPTWFASFSSAETRWKHLLKILSETVHGKTLTDEDIAKMDWFQKCTLISKDPVTCARHFQHQIQKFITNVLMSAAAPVGIVTNYFYKVEFQMRGSPHIHMLMWIKDAPKLDDNFDNEREVIDYVQSYITVTRDTEIDELVKLQEHSHSRTCKKKQQEICRFSYPLPPLPETMILTPLDTSTDKSAMQKHCENWKKIGKTLNTFKKGETMDFNSFLEKLDMTYDNYLLAIRSSLSSNKMFMKRDVNETRINSYNKTLLQCWRANMDLQYVLDPYACAMYIVTYIAKSQRGISNLLYAATKEAREGNETLRKQVKCIGRQFLTHVELSAQEAVYYILQMPLKKSSRQVIFINTAPQNERCVLLKNFNSIQQLSDDSEEIQAISVHQRYAARPKSLQHLCLADFVSKFRVTYKRKSSTTNADSEDSDIDEADEDNSTFTCLGAIIRKRKTPACIRYVRYQEIEDQENYFREVILLFHPWSDESQLMGQSETFTEHYRVLSKEFDIKTKMDEYSHKSPILDQAIIDAENVTEDMLDEQWNTYAPTRAEDKEDEETGIGAEVCPELHLPDLGVADDESGTGVISTSGTLMNYMKNDEYLQLIRSLNKQQEEFFLYILHHFKTSEVPLYQFLTGGAGVGKSVLVHAIYQALTRFFNSTPGSNPDEPKVLLAAPTGKAAHLIKGNTLHSLLKIPANQGFQYKPLTNEKLNTLRCKFKHVRLLIIDEISMVGNKMLLYIHQRLQQINGSNRLFGGISMLAVGDLFQLKPVFDGWIFQNLSQEYGPLALNLWAENFRLFELNIIMRQKDSKDFAELLNRLREGKQTPSDIKFLLQRKIVTDLLHPDYPVLTPHIYVRNADVDSHNQIVCEAHGSVYLKLPASDVVLGDVTQSVKTRILSSIPTDTSKTMGLSKELKTAIGLRNELSCNFDIDDGMTNGAAFVLQATGPVDAKGNLQYLWASFEDNCIGKLTRNRNKNLYKSDVNKMWTPIFKVKRQFPVGRYKAACVLRQQFPVRCAAAKTTHRCQGDTMKSAVVDFAGKTFPHTHYVALSRVTTIDQLFIRNLNESKIRVDARVQREMERLRQNMPSTTLTSNIQSTSKLVILFQNVSSLHAHIQDIQNSFIYASPDLMIFVETKLKPADDNADFLIPGYQLHRFDFPAISRATYGIAVYSRNNFIPESSFVYSYFHTSSGVIEMVSIQLGNTCHLLSDDIAVHGIYISPRVKKDSIKRFIEHDCNASALGGSIYMGDFNEDLLKKPSDNYIGQSLSCKQLVTTPTTDRQTLIDHVYVTDPIEDMCSVHVLESYFSDHKPVLLQLGKK